jgi:serine/threonine protein kinase
MTMLFPLLGNLTRDKLKEMGFQWAAGGGRGSTYLSKEGKQVIIRGQLSRDLASLPLLDDTTVVDGETVAYRPRFTGRETIALADSDFPRIPRIEYYSMPHGRWSDCCPIEYVDNAILKLAPWRTDQVHHEARILARLDHPNIVRLLSIVTLDGRFAGFGMEALDEIFCPLAATHQVDEQLPAFVQETVEYLHQNRIYHCDIRLGNIMVSEQGRLKLIDFDIAQTDVLAAPRTYIAHARHSLAISPRLDDLDVYMSVVLLHKKLCLREIGESVRDNQDLQKTALDSFCFYDTNNLKVSDYFDNVSNRVLLSLRSHAVDSAG